MTETGAGQAPATALELMRSRFEAYRSGDQDWLLRSWHPSTRPERFDLSDNPRWRGLQIVDVEAGGVEDDRGIVEFRASYLVPPGRGAERAEVAVLHERSRFVRERGQWFYLDGEIDPGSDGSRPG